VNRQRFLDTLSDVVTIARGPKPAAAMHEVGLTPTHRVPEPNTWRELLQTIDANVPVANQTVALQEYGITNPSLIAGLEARGADVLRLQVYRWELPEDEPPAGRQCPRLCRRPAGCAAVHRGGPGHARGPDGRADGVGRRRPAAIGQAVIGSVGPTTSEVLREYGWPVDLEPEHPKMGPLVALAAQRSRAILDRKQPVARPGVVQPGAEDRQALVQQPLHESLPPRTVRRGAGLADASSRTLHGRVPRGPRRRRRFWSCAKTPALCSEVMCTAVRRLGVDAAIIFSDLLPILEPMGLDLEFAQGEGPIIHNPVREGADVDRVLELESVDSLDFVTETVRQTRRDLPGTSAVDRVRRGSVHLGQLRDRRRIQPQLSPYQDADVPRCGCLADADGTLRPRRHPVFERPGGCRSPVRPAVRFMGRMPEPRRLS
jgi:uroporphyrinogen decarboxylase